MEHLKVELIKGREYDYLGWNNIDPEKYSKRKVETDHILFGSSSVRKALTLGVNRFEIINDYLLNYGQIASTPVSPIFKEIVNSGISPYAYDPSLSRELLKAENWKDTDNDGILEKGGVEFSFTLNYPSGNPRRDFAGVIIKNNLKMLGIDVKLEPLELSVFFERLFNRELNAWMAGWSIPIPPDLKLYWYSKLDAAPFNVGGFRNRDVDILLDKIEREKNPSLRKDLYLKLQDIFYEENPVTFLYWIDNIVIYNRRIKNINITPLGAIHHVWEWQLDE
jgi:peptide/nickel transport system substrate-binding protein